MLLATSRPIALGTLLFALAGHASSLLAQGPTPFQITTNDAGMTVFGYADENERIVAKAANGDLIWFDAGTSGAPGLMFPGPTTPSFTASEPPVSNGQVWAWREGVKTAADNASAANVG